MKTKRLIEMTKLLTFLSLIGLAGSFAPNKHFRRSSSSLQASSTSCDVAVFGGGFGGLYTALAISREARLKNKKLDVALIEPSDSFVFLPLLYDLTVGTATELEVCPFYNDLLRNTGVRQIQASLESISSNGTAVLSPGGDSLSFRAGVVAVGSSPQCILERVPGALEYAQPFYTAADAKKMRRLLNDLEERIKKNPTDAAHPRIAVVGGGYGGVELAASVKRRLKAAQVTLLSRGAPMAGTRGENLVDKALKKLGVVVRDASVASISKNNDGALVVHAEASGDEESATEDILYDTVLWTAGSGPADPIPSGCEGIRISESGRIATDTTLRCIYNQDSRKGAPCIWALGDCSEMERLSDQPATPRTAQAAMQQAEVVASNVLAQLEAAPGRVAPAKTFAFQDLGSMLTLGGPNGAVLAPRGGAFAPIFAPLLDTVDEALGVADKVVSSTIGRSPLVEQFGLSPEALGLSLGSHGLIGADTDDKAGTLAGTISGAARRAVYAVRMPTTQQKAVSFLSAAISTAASLAKEASDRSKK
jgi:NADH dehydrogenase FAD-containing subunit